MNILEKLDAGQSVKIVFFGDSVTQGCFEGEADPEDQQYVYHARFCNMLREKYPQAKIQAINAGIGGNTAGMGLYRMQKDVLEQKPDFCVVCFGINDTTCCALNRLTILIKFAKNMLAMIKPNMDEAAYSLLANCKPKESYRYAMDKILTKLEENYIPAMVLTPNRMSLASVKDKNDPVYFLSAINAYLMKRGTMDKMMDIARDVTKSHGVPVADGYEHWKVLEQKGIVTNASYVNGTNHPSRELHQELANVLFREFEKM